MKPFIARVLVCWCVTPFFIACGSSSSDDSHAAAGAGGSSVGGGQGVAGSGGSAGAPAPNCGALGACCADLDKLGLTTTAACQTIASAQDDSSCFNALDNYGAFCAGPGSTAFYCDMSISKGYCSILVFDTSEKSTADMVCMEGGGTPVASCPTANLVGCCAPSVLQGGCNYTNENPPQTKADCSTGIWSTVPPS